MTEYLYYILTTIGISYLITESELLKTFRMWVSKVNNNPLIPFKWFVSKFNGVINCIYCCSFWIGVLVYLLRNVTETSYIFYSFSVMGVIYVVKNTFHK